MKIIFLSLMLIGFQSQALELVDARKVIDMSDRYEMMLSRQFIQAQLGGPDKIQVVANPNFMAGEFTPVIGFVSSFGGTYPEHVMKDVDGLRQAFAGSREVVLGECKLGFMGQNSSTIYGVATWGQGQGVAIVMPYTSEMESIIRETLEGIKLLPNACNWPFAYTSWAKGRLGARK